MAAPFRTAFSKPHTPQQAVVTADSTCQFQFLPFRPLLASRPQGQAHALRTSLVPITNRQGGNGNACYVTRAPGKYVMSEPMPVPARSPSPKPCPRKEEKEPVVLIHSKASDHPEVYFDTRPSPSRLGNFIRRPDESEYIRLIRVVSDCDETYSSYKSLNTANVRMENEQVENMVVLATSHAESPPPLHFLEEPTEHSSEPHFK